MPLYLVSYDLRGPNKDYERLQSELERLGGHRPLRSVYLLNVDTQSAKALKSHLTQFIDDNDQMIVVPFTDRPAHVLALKGTNDWLDDNV